MINLVASFVHRSAPIRSAFQAIEKSKAQIALVVDQERRLLGTLTDGDIRRAIICGNTLDTPIDNLMTKKFIYADENSSEAAIREIFRQNDIAQLPLVDEELRVCGLLTRSQVFKKLQPDVPIIILAGGKGSRLLPLTESLPKPMIYLGDKPMLQIILEHYASHGFKKFYISVNYKKEFIESYFENGDKWGVSIQYLDEQTPMGTAGCLHFLYKKTNMPFIVTNGDVLTTLDPKLLLDFFTQSNSAFTTCVKEEKIQIPFGVVETKGGLVTSITEKPSVVNLVNAGVYVLSPTVLDECHERKFLNMPDLINDLIKKGKKVTFFPLMENWIDVGTHENLKEARLNWS